MIHGESNKQTIAKIKFTLKDLFMNKNLKLFINHNYFSNIIICLRIFCLIFLIILKVLRRHAYLEYQHYQSWDL